MRLAAAVLARDMSQGWGLETNPNRLQVQTIDSLCVSLAARLPLLSRMGPAPQIREDAWALYREAARETGYVETVFGRRLWLPEIKSSNPARRQGAERAAINAPMQGTAADLIKMAMIAVDRWLAEHRLNTRLILQVHDELVLEVPEGELDRVKRELPALMSGVAKLAVPLVVDVGAGSNWDKAH